MNARIWTLIGESRARLWGASPRGQRPQRDAALRLQQQPDVPAPTPLVPPGRPQPEPGQPPAERPQPGHEINVPRPSEIEIPGRGPEIGPGVGIPGGTPESPPPGGEVEVPMPNPNEVPPPPGVQ